MTPLTYVILGLWLLGYSHAAGWVALFVGAIHVFSALRSRSFYDELLERVWR